MNPGWTVLLDLASRGAPQAASLLKHQAPPSPRVAPQRGNGPSGSPVPAAVPKQKAPPPPLRDDHDEGIWPDDTESSVKYYDAKDGCKLATGPKHKKGIRPSWTEGLFMGSEDKSGHDACCEHIYCFAKDCAAFSSPNCA